MKKILFIINPVSGTSGKEKFIEKLEAFRGSSSGCDCEVMYTQYRDHATEIALNSTNSYDYVVAVGGDGTVHEVAKGLINTHAVFGIIPFGSGNGVARHLNIPLDIRGAIEMILNGETETVDTYTVNGKFAIGVSGIGFDAHIAHEFEKSKSRGLITYAKLAVSRFFKFKGVKYRLFNDEIDTSGEAFLISMANTSQWGNDFYISPDSKMGGGKIKVVVVDNVSLFRKLMLVPALLTKTINRLSFVKVYEVDEVNIDVDQDELHIDGEAVDGSREMKIKVMKDALKVVHG